jgi:hypothetical protein
MRAATSGVGTERTCRSGRSMSVVGGRAENIGSERVFPSLTQLGHPSAWTVPKNRLRSG